MKEQRTTKAGDVFLLHSVDKATATLQTLDWSEESLRSTMQAMLQRHKLAPLDLLRSYDKSFWWWESLEMVRKADVQSFVDRFEQLDVDGSGVLEEADVVLLQVTHSGPTHCRPSTTPPQAAQRPSVPV